MSELQRIRRLLWEEWDPLSVNDIAPADEYDSYADRVFTMLREGAGEWEITGYLVWLATEHMGGDPDDDFDEIARHAASIARKIILVSEGKE